jgi:hypothetical protein
MVHDWENKQVKVVSREAVAFYARFKIWCDSAGRGHKERFCQAVIEVATKFGLEPEAFFKDIMSLPFA